MRRNNTVFLMGRVMRCEERTVHVESDPVPVLDLRLQTDKPEISGQHRVLVRGRQALELKHFFRAAQPDLPDLMVIGWLRSGEREAVIMAERVTVLVSRAVRQEAVEAIKNEEITK